jgi:hypothetical protein
MCVYTANYSRVQSCMSLIAIQVVRDAKCFLYIPETPDILDALTDHDVHRCDTDVPLARRLSPLRCVCHSSLTFCPQAYFLVVTIVWIRTTLPD